MNLGCYNTGAFLCDILDLPPTKNKNDHQEGIPFLGSGTSN